MNSFCCIWVLAAAGSWGGFVVAESLKMPFWLACLAHSFSHPARFLSHQKCMPTTTTSRAEQLEEEICSRDWAMSKRCCCCVDGWRKGAYGLLPAADALFGGGGGSSLTFFRIATFGNIEQQQQLNAPKIAVVVVVASPALPPKWLLRPKSGHNTHKYADLLLCNLNS